MPEPDLLSIGELARRAGVRPSLLRYYEEQGLLLPTERTSAGYRLYHPDAEQTLRLIQRAQRLGFALADIRTLLDGWRSGNLDDTMLLQTAEARAMALERQLTQLLVLRHELTLFLHDVYRQAGQSGTTSGAQFLHQLVDRICADPVGQTAETTLDWLLTYTGCMLSSSEGQAILARLRGQHVHLWQEAESYHILVVSHEPAVEQALLALVQLETQCAMYASPAEHPTLSRTEEGYLLTAYGEHAFLFARLFLALEHE